MLALQKKRGNLIERAPQDVRIEEGTKVPNVGVVIDGRTARIEEHALARGVERTELVLRVGQCVC